MAAPTALRFLPRLQLLTSHIPLPSAQPATSIVAANKGPTYALRATMSTHSIPKTMKGVLVEKTGGVEVLQYLTNLPVPEPKEGQLLIKNEVCGINYIDT